MQFREPLWFERLLGGLKYLVGFYFMLNGALAPFLGGDVTDLGWLYSHPIPLTIFGIIIFVSGAWLVYGKIRKSRKRIGEGIMATFLCFLFFGVLNTLAYGIAGGGANFIAAVVMGLLYLRWRFKTAYIDPRHFAKDVEELNERH